MVSPNPINELLQKPMDRKEFLRHVAFGMAVVTGMANIFKLMQPVRVPSSPSTNSYGATPYGGFGSPRLRK